MILKDSSYTHITFRCLNREFFFKSSEVKNQILKIWRAYFEKYQIKIFDYVIMDNHCHLLVSFKTVSGLASFMRITNSLIARAVNKFLKRDSERYKSPRIENTSYLKNTIGYIWFNIFRERNIDPKNYKYCSLFKRIRELNDPLLSSYKNLPLELGKSIISFVQNLYKAFKKESNTNNLFEVSVFEHSHTIGSIFERETRTAYFKNLVKRDSS